METQPPRTPPLHLAANPVVLGVLYAIAGRRRDLATPSNSFSTSFPSLSSTPTTYKRTRNMAITWSVGLLRPPDLYLAGKLSAPAVQLYSQRAAPGRPVPSSRRARAAGRNQPSIFPRSESTEKSS